MKNLLKPVRISGISILTAAALVAGVLLVSPSVSPVNADTPAARLYGLTASAGMNSANAGNIVDSDPDTFWSNEGNAPAGVFEVNLGGKYEITEIRYQDDFDRPLRVSLDGQIIYDQWTVGASENTYARISPTQITSGSTLRFELTEGTWLVPEDIHIYGVAESASNPPTSNPSTGDTGGTASTGGTTGAPDAPGTSGTISGLTVSAPVNPAAAANIVDGNPETFWSNDGNAGSGNFEINLGGTYQVTEIRYQDDWNRPLKITLDGVVIHDQWTSGATESDYATITPTASAAGSTLRFELTAGTWLVPEEVQIDGIATGGGTTGGTNGASTTGGKPVDGTTGGSSAIPQLPPNTGFDYQIGSDYQLPANAGVVSRDWFGGSPAPDAYNICYVNAFQTQSDDDYVDRPDEKSNWPQGLVLTSLGDDPNWTGEYLIDITTPAKRSQAAAWVGQMVQTCKNKGFQAVEYDNLDSWTRFEDTPVANQVTFGRAEAIGYASLLTDLAHDLGLAVAQKNTADLTRSEAIDMIGFDFALVEECGTYNECDVFTAVYGNKMIAVEYTDAGFATACAGVGDSISVIRRDRDVTAPGSPSYTYNEC